jgi:hypothetical protein
MDPLIATPDFGHDECLSNDLFGLVPGPGGPTDLAILDVTDSTQGIHWFSWDVKTSTLSATPRTEWISDRPFELYPSFLSIPTGRRSQALVRARVLPIPDQPNELLVWGRTLADVGPSEEGTHLGDCTFWAAEPPPITGAPPTTEGPGSPDPGEPDPGEPEIQDPRARPAESRGCRSIPGTSAGALVALALMALRRRPALT